MSKLLHELNFVVEYMIGLVEIIMSYSLDSYRKLNKLNQYNST
jgi:hypothetical protein